MMYMRHEAGHVFNYAYRLYTTPEWRRLFGPFFRVVSRRLPARSVQPQFRPAHRGLVRAEASGRGFRRDVRRLADAAQPLAPSSTRDGRRCEKLRYVERVARALADVEPIVKTGEVDITPDDIGVTVEQFYEQAAQERQARIDIALDAHLGQIFLTRRRKESRPAADIVQPAYAPELVEKITYWTGVRAADRAAG